MIVPDRISPIIGYRTWQWDSLGLKSLNNTRWVPGEAMKASCAGSYALSIKMGANHQSPADGCSCGIYAAKNLQHLHDINYIQFGNAIGEVSLWGKVWDHELGYRAEYAYPKNLVISVHALPFLVTEVMNMIDPLMLYNADIFLTENTLIGTKRIPLYKKDEGIQPEGMDLIVEQRKGWYDYHAPIAPLLVGDKVSIWNKGMAIVGLLNDTDAIVSLYNKTWHRITRKDICWSRSNNRWETVESGYEVPNHWPGL